MQLFSSQATAVVRAGLESDTQHGAVIPPLYLSSNYTFKALGEPREYDYSRSGNPTRTQLAEALTHLEGGAGGVVCSSGMAAVLVVLAQLPTGQRVVADKDIYGGTFRLLNSLEQQKKIELEWVDLCDESQRREALQRGCDLLWVETPSNPLLKVTDLKEVISDAHRVGAKAAVDNTFLSPALQKPIQFGADFVVHSTTKYINGHSDVVGGAVIAATEELAEEIQWWANCLGVTGSPYDSYLCLRGLRTLFARMKVHEANTSAIAELLSGHSRVRKAYYPGLPSHPGHELASRQQLGFGGMLSVELDLKLEQIQQFVGRLNLFSLAESLGGVESLIAHPETMTHAAMTPEARNAAGIGPGLIRLSVGIENGEDLLNDLEQALDF